MKQLVHIVSLITLVNTGTFLPSEIFAVQSSCITILHIVPYLQRVKDRRKRTVRGWLYGCFSKVCPRSSI